MIRIRRRSYETETNTFYIFNRTHFVFRLQHFRICREDFAIRFAGYSCGKSGCFQDNFLRQHFRCLLIDRSLYDLPLTVQLAKAFRKGLGLHGIFRQEQLHSQMDLSHPTCRIDPGRQNIAYRGGIEVFALAVKFEADFLTVTVMFVEFSA